jgi:hypothetical protein
MSEETIVSPGFQHKSFHCPHCKVKARQYWSEVKYNTEGQGQRIMLGLNICICEHCKDYSLWKSQNMIFPDTVPIEMPNADLPEDIVLDYQEAISILHKSPRGAAALLRLAIQKLCKELGQKGKDLNLDIALLVKHGLPSGVQKALDIVRVTGNESVHPGQIDLRDDVQTAMKLFRLLNFIADKMISEPKEIDSLYNQLPESKLQEIAKRDS